MIEGVFVKNDNYLECDLEGSAYYKGAAGSKYFDWQDRNGEIAGKIEARKFTPYIKHTDSILDFGCGGGRVLRHINCQKRIGVEINPAARAVASQVGIECYESLRSIPDNSVNVVISNHALEHVLFPISVLKMLIGKLERSGLLILCVPMDDWRSQPRYNAADIHHHLHTWTPQLLGNCLCEAGLAPEQFSVSILTHAWFPGTAAVYGRLPEFLFDTLCRIHSVVSRRRQLFAIASTSGDV